MKSFKTYLEDDDFPQNTWFADWQPREDLDNILKGEILIRHRDNRSTTCIFSIPVGGSKGIDEKKIEKIIPFLLNELNKKEPIPWTPNKESKGYKDGYKTGLNWEEDYIPGGPWHYSAGERDSEEFKKRAEATQENYKNWMQGFYKGIEDSGKIDSIKAGGVFS